MITAKQIAEMLGISPSTVSLVLNNKPGISEATRRRVLDALGEAGYEKAERSGRKKGTLQFILYKKHGQIVSDTPFFSQLLEGVETQARRLGITLMISYINAQEQSVEPQLQSILAAGSCRGFILLATEMDARDLAPFAKAGLPFVVLDSYFEGAHADFVVINNVQGAFNATLHLAGKGHRRIGHLASRVAINNFAERREGHRKALQALSLPDEETLCYRLSPAPEAAYREMKDYLLDGRVLPTAFLSDNDNIAFGAIRALREEGYAVPRDISVMGFDDIPQCELLDPPLSTVRVPKHHLGIMAVDRLVQLWENAPGIPVKIEVATELVLRQSVLPAQG